MSDVLDVNDSNFEKEVLNSELPVLVEFGASWCGPCKKQLPILKQLANEHPTTLKVVKVDIDDAPNESKYYGILSVPTLILFVKGEIISTVKSLTPLKDLQELVKGRV